MNTDKKVLRIFSVVTFSLLLLASLLPLSLSGRIVGAMLLVPLAVLWRIFIKKRAILSINRKEVILLMTVIPVVYLMLLYLSGIWLGFARTPISGAPALVEFVLPIVLVVIASEHIRHVAVIQNDTSSTVLTYFICLLSDILICSSLAHIGTFGRFMDVFGLTFVPAVIENLVFHYISKRYGVIPNTVYRLFLTLYVYLLPTEPFLSDALGSILKLLLAIFTFIFIDALYEKKRRYALHKTSKLSVVLGIFAALLMVGAGMLVSNQFAVGAYVIATPSMTGELNIGDTAIYVEYDDQLILEGQVIVFEKNGMVTIHRVVDIQNINGANRYFTQGDANSERDSGYIFDSDIIGLVNYKIPWIGYPTLWVRSLFGE